MLIFHESLQLLVKLSHQHTDLTAVVKEHKELFALLRAETSFLSNECRARQRLWFVEHNTKEGPRCKMCDSFVKWDERMRKFRTFCSIRCSHKCSDTQNKKINTCILKYGTDNPTQNTEVRDKIKRTNLERYGVEHNWNKGSISREKQKQTLIERYGVEHNWNKGSISREKQKQTLIEKYGVEHPSLIPGIKQKTKNTNLLRYGVSNKNQAHLIDKVSLLEDYDWMYDQYINQHKTASKIAAEQNIHVSTICRHLEKHCIDVRAVHQFSEKCIDWLNIIMKENSIHIQHALNGGEHQIPGTRYRVDGYCKETNTVYEFHGDLFHGNPKIFSPNDQCHPWSDLTAEALYQKTIEREDLIKSLGYNLVVMWENEFSQMLETGDK